MSKNSISGCFSLVPACGLNDGEGVGEVDIDGRSHVPRALLTLQQPSQLHGGGLKHAPSRDKGVVFSLHRRWNS
jgi:hypothetical protein